MVRESVAFALAAKVKPSKGTAKSWMNRIRALVDESASIGEQESGWFDEGNARRLVGGIADITALDPAVGSGAFPMTALHVLTLALRRLDPKNEHWERVQLERAAHRAAQAYEATDDRIREATLEEVEATFRRYRDSDFGRKLYLIQNSLFGVDIQPIACQIAKLRFFISLAIEQKATEDEADNYGIRPLPNLETRFIAADSLLSAGGQRALGEMGDVGRIEEELKLNREKHFNAKTPEAKRECREKDDELRSRLAGALEARGLGGSHIEKVAVWNPYDQNGVAEWFDPEYMFGVERFDVVIGNPPYIQLQKNRGEMRRKYQGAGYDVFASAGDVYQLFYERGMTVAREGDGVLAYITSNSWLKAEYGRRLRQYFALRHTPLTLVEMGKDVFENAIVDTALLIVRNGKDGRPVTCRAVDVEETPDGRFPPPKKDWGTLTLEGERPWMALSSVERTVMDKMEALGTPLRQWDISIYYGIKTGYNEAFIVDTRVRDRLIAEDPRSDEILKPVLRGRDIARYRANWGGLWLIDAHNGHASVPPINVEEYPAIKAHLDGFYDHLVGRQDQGVTPYNLRNCAYHEHFNGEKLLWRDMAASGTFAYSDAQIFTNDKAFMMTGQNLRFLCAVLNSLPVSWLVSKSGLTTGMGLTQWKKFVVENIPVVRADDSAIAEIDRAVTELLAMDGGRRLGRSRATGHLHQQDGLRSL